MTDLSSQTPVDPVPTPPLPGSLAELGLDPELLQGALLQAGPNRSVPSRLDDERYLRMALGQAQRAAELGEVPIGAVVVFDPYCKATRKPLLPEPVVIAAGCNLRETAQDPAGHAEFLACKAASELLGVWRLTGCTVYVTLEPCIMCAGLLHQARVDRCVYGAPDQKAGALGTLYKMNEDSRLNHTYEVRAGVLEQECVAVLREFFAQRRKKR
ncbi:MAG: nucleoside deaminase [Coriobacteriia bacterium]|nr:nucleoside deaminase [Coriobacteriia bacterium]